MVATVETEVQLTDGKRLQPDKVIFHDSSYLICFFDGDRHYFPPHRVKEVNKVQVSDSSTSTDA